VTSWISAFNQYPEHDQEITSDVVPVIVMLDVDVFTALLALLAVVSVVLQLKVDVPVHAGLMPEITALPDDSVAIPLIVLTCPPLVWLAHVPLPPVAPQNEL
jgi:hypothetical protein